MTDLWFGTSGPRDASIVLVGESWGREEADEQKPFVGQSGQLLTGMLAEAGINRNEILFTNVVAARPQNNEMWRFFHPAFEAPTTSLFRKLHPTPMVVDEQKRLLQQIASSPRKVVLAAGNYALWALSPFTGAETKTEAEGRRAPTGIMNWRGSMTYVHNNEDQATPTKLIPIIHPAAIYRQWELRAPTVHDLRARVPKALKDDWRQSPAAVTWAPPTFSQACSRLEFWLRTMDAGTTLPLVCDIETIRKSNLITVVGFSDSVNFAMAIPLLDKTDVKGTHKSFWTIEQEATLIMLIRRVVTHRNVFLIGQNFIYDMQYFDYWFGVTPNVKFDTMLAWHVLFPGLPKGLDYLSSMLCDYHWYWKEDGKEWDERGTIEQLLDYNCIDDLREFECYDTLKDLIPKMGMSDQWVERMENNDLAYRMMKRGIKIDKKRRHDLSIELMDILNQIYSILEHIIPSSTAEEFVLRSKIAKAESKGKEPPKKTSKTPWFTSPDKQKIVFQDMLGMKLPKSRKTGAATLDHEGLAELMLKYPEWRKLFNLLINTRSVAVFRSHFIEAGLEFDGRMKSSFNPAGTETFRWSSSTNAFGRGTNLQNVPAGEEDD